MGKWLIAFNDLDREQNLFLLGGTTDTGKHIKPYSERTTNDYIQGFPGSGKTILLLYAVGAELDANPKTKIVIVEFTHALIQMLKVALGELTYNGHAIDTSGVRVMTIYNFYDRFNEKADLILCDEVQDVPLKVLERMKSAAKRVLIAGDHNQSIYSSDPRWHLSPCTPEETHKCFSPELTSLRILHRLGGPIIKAVNAFMPDLKIMEGRIPMTKDNIQIRLWEAQSSEQEVKFVTDDAIATVNIGDTVGILFPHKSDVVDFANEALLSRGKSAWTRRQAVSSRGEKKTDMASLNSYLESCGLPMQYVGNGFGNMNLERTITLMTYFSAKGLDFDKVFLPGCSVGTDTPRDERSDRVFMVAMTRSRKDLIISYVGTPNGRIMTFEDQCLKKHLGETENTPNDDIFGF